MKILAIILIIFSLTKLGIAGSQEKQELTMDLFCWIKDNVENFQKKATLFLIIDGILGLLAGAIVLYIL